MSVITPLTKAAAAWDASMTAWGASESTRECRLTLLRRLERDGWSCPSQIRRADVEAVIGAPGLSPWSRSTYFSHLKSFFDWAVDAGVIEMSPMDGMRRPRRPGTKPRPLTTTEAEQALSAAAQDRELYMWLTLALYAGLRAHEIAKIRGEDVDETRIFVRGKGGKEAYIPTHPRVWEAAAAFPRNGWWFPTPYRHTRPGDHIDAGTVTSAVSRHFRAVGITAGSIHRGRHSYATSLLRSGANIRVVQELMRHSSMATTEAYLDVSDDERRSAVARLA